MPVLENSARNKRKGASEASVEVVGVDSDDDSVTNVVEDDDMDDLFDRSGDAALSRRLQPLIPGKFCRSGLPS